MAYRSRACGTRGATASLDGACARRQRREQVGTKKRLLGSNKETGLRWKSALGAPPTTKSGGNGARHPRRAACHHGIGVDQQLARTGNERDLVSLSGRGEASVERGELGVPMEGRGERGIVYVVAQPLTTSLDVPRGRLVATILVVGRKAGQRRDLLAADPADLGHAHQNGDGGAQRDAVNAGNQIEALGEVAVSADRGDQVLELLLEKPAQSLDLVIPELPLRIAGGLAIVLAPGDLVDDLIDQRLVRRQYHQSRVRRRVDLLGCGGAVRDQ